VLLDLGDLHDIAEIKLNGSPWQVSWYAPYQVDITPHLTPGSNLLEIAVTNNWANRLIGDEQEPADFEWGRDRGETWDDGIGFFKSPAGLPRLVSGSGWYRRGGK
jgi:hypothetical protein